MFQVVISISEKNMTSILASIAVYCCKFKFFFCFFCFHLTLHFYNLFTVFDIDSENKEIEKEGKEARKE